MHSQAIREEDRKKNKIIDAINLDTQDELTIYLRQPYIGTQAPTTRRFSKLGRKAMDEETVSDKIEIDSDNIETPPAIRRLFSPPKEIKPIEKEPCKRERCSSSLQNRETKIAISKPIANTDLGKHKSETNEGYTNRIFQFIAFSNLLPFYSVKIDI